MTEKELCKLNKTELLALLAEESRRAETLELRLAALEKRLAKESGETAEPEAQLEAPTSASRPDDGPWDGDTAAGDAGAEDFPRQTEKGGIRELPGSARYEEALARLRYRARYKSVLRSTVAILITAAAIAVLLATLWLPVLRIYGKSMTPTLSDGEIVLSMKGSSFKTGDIIAFYYNNKILVKRVIAQAGEWVDIDADGNVYVNDTLIDEPYLADGEKAYGETDITLPYQVPDGKVFVMGDHRSQSIDSRSSQIGCVSQEQIVGRLLLRIWPLAAIGSP